MHGWSVRKRHWATRHGRIPGLPTTPCGSSGICTDLSATIRSGGVRSISRRWRWWRWGGLPRDREIEPAQTLATARQAHARRGRGRHRAGRAVHEHRARTQCPTWRNRTPRESEDGKETPSRSAPITRTGAPMLVPVERRGQNRVFPLAREGRLGLWPKAQNPSRKAGSTAVPLSDIETHPSSPRMHLESNTDGSVRTCVGRRQFRRRTRRVSNVLRHGWS